MSPRARIACAAPSTASASRLPACLTTNSGSDSLLPPIGSPGQQAAPRTPAARAAAYRWAWAVWWIENHRR